MFVLMDMEWYETKACWFITQLSALRIDEKYNIADRYDSLAAPAKFCNPETVRWQDISFSGRTKKDFILAPDISTVFTELYRWLKTDDVLVWWHESGEEKFINRIQLQNLPFPKTRVIGKQARNLLAGKNRRGSPYELCRKHGIPVSNPEHCSAADVQTLCNLLSAIRFPLHLLEEQDWQKKIAQFRGVMIPDTKTAACRPKTENRFSYFRDSKNKMIHSVTCPERNSMKRISGITLQQAIDLRLAPCPCCRMKYEKFVLNSTAKPKISSIVYSINSRESVAHYSGCPVVKRIDPADLRKLKSAEHARGAGFRFCKICSSIERFCKPIMPFVKSCCASNGLKYYIKNGVLHIVSKYDRWQIVIGEDTGVPTLYHKNSQKKEGTDPDIRGYHQQPKSSHSVQGILRYIVNHDRYRSGIQAVELPKKPENKKQHDKKGRLANKELKRKQQAAKSLFTKSDLEETLQDYYTYS